MSPMRHHAGVPGTHLFVERRGPVDPDSSKLVEELWVERSLGDGWLAAFRLIPQDGQPVVAELRIFPEEENPKRKRGQWSAHMLGLDAIAPRGGLTARVIRRVRLEDVQSAFSEVIANLVQRFGSETPLPPLDPFLSRIRIEEIARLANQRPGPAGRDDTFYAAVAANYLARIRAGSKQPLKELSTELSRPTSHVRQLLATARDRGLLTRAVQGRAGGELTEAGRSALIRTDSQRSTSERKQGTDRETPR